MSDGGRTDVSVSHCSRGIETALANVPECDHELLMSLVLSKRRSLLTYCVETLLDAMGWHVSLNLVAAHLD